jgi:hypothetical protein
MKKPLLFLLLLLALSPLQASAQAPADITSERHHDLLLRTDKVRIFAVNLRPAEQSYVKHEHNFAMITLQDCELVMWAEGQSDVLNFRLHEGDVRFLFGGPARGLRNDRSQECHTLTVEFLDPKVTTFGYHASVGGWDYGSNIRPLAVDSRVAYETSLSLELATLKRVQLLPGDDLPQPSQEADEVLIPLTDVDLKLDKMRIRKAAGEATAVPARKSKLLNAGTDPARFVMIELR